MFMLVNKRSYVSCTWKVICQSSCHTKCLVFYFASIYYLCCLSIISFDRILIMAGGETRKALWQSLDLLLEEKGNLVILAKYITVSLIQENTKYFNVVANLQGKKHLTLLKLFQKV